MSYHRVLCLLSVVLLLSLSHSSVQGEKEEPKEKPKFIEERLTNNPVIDSEPEFSPDMTKVVFISISNEEGRGNLHIMNADGKMKTILHNVMGEVHSEPHFFPDGKKVLFRWARGDVRGYATIVLETKERKDLPLIPGEMMGSAMAPDGSKFAYISRGDKQKVMVFDFETEKFWEVKGCAGDCDMPAFSKDGKYIFYAEFDNDGTSICRADVDGSNRTVLVKPDPEAEGCDATYPRPIKDGRVFYLSDMRTGEFEVFSMDADGKDKKVILEPKIPFLSFDVTQDGAKVVFLGNIGVKKWELFLLDVKTGAVAQMTDTPYDKKIPEFSPDGKFVLYVAEVMANPEIFKIKLAE